MHKDTEQNIKECYSHLEPYMKDPKCTKELREMCGHCEKYCGLEHDYSECKENACFRFWLCYKYLNWRNSFCFGG